MMDNKANPFGAGKKALSDLPSNLPPPSDHAIDVVQMLDKEKDPRKRAQMVDFILNALVFRLTGRRS